MDGGLLEWTRPLQSLPALPFHPCRFWTWTWQLIGPQRWSHEAFHRHLNSFLWEWNPGTWAPGAAHGQLSAGHVGAEEKQREALQRQGGWGVGSAPCTPHLTILPRKK